VRLPERAKMNSRASIVEEIFLRRVRICSRRYKSFVISEAFVKGEEKRKSVVLINTSRKKILVEKEIAREDPLSNEFVVFPKAWMNTNEKMSDVLDVFYGCSFTAIASMGSLQKAISDTALRVFLIEQRKRGKLEAYLNDFWAFKIANARDQMQKKMDGDYVLIARHFERERKELERKLTSAKTENVRSRARADATRIDLYETKELVRKLEINIEEFQNVVHAQKAQMDQFKSNEIALRYKTETQFDKMYQQFTRDFVLLRHAKKQQEKAHKIEIDKRDRNEKVVSAKTAQRFEKMYETLVKDIVLRDHEISQLDEALHTFQTTLKLKTQAIEDMEINLKMVNEEKSRVERALFSANHHHDEEIQDLNIVISDLLDNIKSLEQAAVEEESRKARIWNEHSLEIESLKKKVLDLRIDQSVVERRVELTRASLEKEYQEKARDIAATADARVVVSIERAARVESEHLHDMTVLKNKFMKEHEDEIETLKSTLVAKENVVLEMSQESQKKIETIKIELLAAKEAYAKELSAVADISSSRALHIENLKVEMVDANKRERMIADELKNVQTSLFAERENVERLETEKQRAEWDYFSETAKLKKVEQELEMKLEQSNLEKFQIERALYTQRANASEIQGEMASMKETVADAKKSVTAFEKKLEQSNLEKFQIERALITQKSIESQLQEENASLRIIAATSEKKLERSNLEKFQIERALITQKSIESQLQEENASLRITAATSEKTLERSNLEKFQIERALITQKSFETQFREARKAAAAERKALYALTQNENAKRHNSMAREVDHKKVLEERQASYAQAVDDIAGLREKVRASEAGLSSERYAREAAEAERDSIKYELNVSVARLTKELSKTLSSSFSRTGDGDEMHTLARENEELAEKVSLLELVALDAREQEALAVDRLEAIETKLREKRKSIIMNHVRLNNKENVDPNASSSAR